jgi:hydroxymethylglutaryl-CoA lyase
MAMPSRVSLFEAGARDGLQNEPKDVPTAVKIELIERLADAGLTRIEAGSFVSPKWVPKMADTAEVLAKLGKRPGVSYAVLTPNMKGLEGAIAAEADEIGVFASATESFSRSNINCSIAESLDRIRPVVEAAAARKLPARGYVSCVLACPFEGEVAPAKVAEVAKALYELGCYEVSLGDTIGAGTPAKAQAMLAACAKHIPIEKLGLHFHDTYGQALANLHACLELGAAMIDSSVAGLGGCPYAPGATGNVATEDVVYMLEGMGIETGVSLDKLIETAWFISDFLGRPPVSRVARAMKAKQKRAA